MGSIHLVIEPGEQIHQPDSRHDLSCQQPQHGRHADHLICNQAQLEIGDHIHQAQGNDLSDNQIHPVELSELGALGVDKQGVQQQRVHTHQQVFPPVGKGVKIVASVPGDIICQRHQGNFQPGFRHPDKALHILPRGAAQFFHSKRILFLCYTGKQAAVQLLPAKIHAHSVDIVLLFRIIPYHSFLFK